MTSMTDSGPPTMKLAWWNMYRVGAGSKEDRVEAIMGTLEMLEVDLIFGCEILQNSDDPPPLHYVYRRVNKYQLCYTTIPGRLDVPDVEKFTPYTTEEYKKYVFKGGNDFTSLCNRAPGHMTLPDRTEVIFFHGPASNDAIKTTLFLTHSLIKLWGMEPSGYRRPWILLGDLNVEPHELENVIDEVWQRDKQYGKKLKKLIVDPGTYTHCSPSGKYSTLDYALTNRGDVKAEVFDSHGWSDHQAVMFSYPLS